MLKSVNQKIALILIAITIFYLIMSYRLPTYPYIPVDADAIPKVLGWLLLGLAIILFFSKDIDTEEQKAKRKVKKKDAIAMAIVIALLLIYITFLETVGFVILTALFIFLSSLSLGYKNHLVNGIVSIVFPIFIYYVFNFLLKINLPQGFLPF